MRQLAAIHWAPLAEVCLHFLCLCVLRTTNFALLESHSKQAVPAESLVAQPLLCLVFVCKLRACAKAFVDSHDHEGKLDQELLPYAKCITENKQTGG